jgi:hypothetical protein
MEERLVEVRVMGEIL